MIPTCISDDEEAAKAVNRRTLTGYAMLPNYRNYWKEAGYVEEMEAVEAALARGETDKVAQCLSGSLARGHDALRFEEKSARRHRGLVRCRHQNADHRAVVRCRKSAEGVRGVLRDLEVDRRRRSRGLIAQQRDRRQDAGSKYGRKRIPMRMSASATLTSVVVSLTPSSSSTTARRCGTSLAKCGDVGCRAIVIGVQGSVARDFAPLERVRQTVRTSAARVEHPNAAVTALLQFDDAVLEPVPERRARRSRSRQRFFEVHLQSPCRISAACSLITPPVPDTYTVSH